MMRALVLQHIACEPPGAYEDVLHERGWELERVELDEGDALPDWHAFGAIIAMGGPMSINDEQELRVPRCTAARVGARGAGLSGPRTGDRLPAGTAHR